MIDPFSPKFWESLYSSVWFLFFINLGGALFLKFIWYIETKLNEFQEHKKLKNKNLPK